MAANRPRKQLALDTNVLLNLAEGKDFAHAFREVFQATGYALRFTPTVLAELVFARVEGEPRQQELAALSLQQVSQWQIVLAEMNSVEEVVAEQFAEQIMQMKLLPPRWPTSRCW